MESEAARQPAHQVDSFMQGWETRRSLLAVFITLGASFDSFSPLP